jgi:hypothetical protein
MYIVDLAKEAMKMVGVTPIVRPIRGGTDGARLSFMGLPTPNILPVDIISMAGMNLFRFKVWKRQLRLL